MSTLKTNNVQVGQSVTATNNFTIYQPSTPDGTVRIGVGNAGAVSSDVLAVNNSGNVGIGISPKSTLTASTKTFQLPYSLGLTSFTGSLDTYLHSNLYPSSFASGWANNAAGGGNLFRMSGGVFYWYRAASGSADANSSLSESMRIDSSGNLLVAKTSSATSSVGFEARANGVLSNTVNGITGVFINRLGNDGSLIDFQQDNTAEGSISVSGTTVSYNGGHLSRWAQMLAKPELLKGTVLSNLDEMNQYTDADGNPVDNEQLNKVKVSDVEGDANVAGVFVNWSHDDQHNVDEINMAMTGDMIIRIAQGVTVQRGDLLMSAGDGTAKPQGDDIVRSKTIAKVTSIHVTCTYEDGSYCVPCVLMAC